MTKLNKVQAKENEAYLNILSERVKNFNINDYKMSSMTELHLLLNEEFSRNKDYLDSLVRRISISNTEDIKLGDLEEMLTADAYLSFLSEDNSSDNYLYEISVLHESLALRISEVEEMFSINLKKSSADKFISISETTEISSDDLLFNRWLTPFLVLCTIGIASLVLLVILI